MFARETCGLGQPASSCPCARELGAHILQAGHWPRAGVLGGQLAACPGDATHKPESEHFSSQPQPRPGGPGSAANTVQGLGPGPISSYTSRKRPVVARMGRWPLRISNMPLMGCVRNRLLPRPLQHRGRLTVVQGLETTPAISMLGWKMTVTTVRAVVKHQQQQWCEHSAD